jgi:hypothetical protein
MQTLTIILTVCDTPPAITHLNLGNVLIHSNNSVKNIVNFCSKGTINFSNYVFPSFVNIPCPESPLACDVDNWADRADAAIRPLMPDIDDFVYKIYILPKDSCTFAGLGAVGPCDSEKRCRIWINGHYANYPISYVHELGHNLGLGHASYGGNEYGDYSDVMGYCCVERCFNAPQSNMLNITVPKRVIKLPLKSIVKLTLLSNEYVMIIDSATEWFVQNRQPIGLDQVPFLFGDSVNVYSTSGFGAPTILQAILKTDKELFEHEHFDVRLIGMRNHKAKIEISPHSTTQKQIKGLS